MFIDVAADVHGRKENIRMECAPTVTSMPMAELLRRIDMYYSRLVARHDKGKSFVCEEVRLLILDRSTGRDVARWVTIEDCSQLTPYCQLYVFQSRARTAENGGDNQAPIPEARLLRLPSATRTGVDRSARPGSSSPKRSSPSRASGSVLCPSPRNASEHVVMQFLQTNDTQADEGRATLDRAATDRTCSAVLLSRLLNAVGVNLAHWNDPSFAFLASAALCVARPAMPPAEFLAFSRAYPSLVKLMHRYLLERYGNGIDQISNSASKSSPQRRTWSPPRATSSPGRTSSGSQPREESPPRRGGSAASPNRRQHSVSARLSAGLASIPTAKDRKLSVYDP